MNNTVGIISLSPWGKSHLILGYDVRLETQPVILTEASPAQSSAPPAVFSAKGLQTALTATARLLEHEAKLLWEQPGGELKQQEWGAEACHCACSEGRAGGGSSQQLTFDVWALHKYGILCSKSTSALHTPLLPYLPLPENCNPSLTYHSPLVLLKSIC